MSKTFLVAAVASNLIATLLAEWPINLLVAATSLAGFALVVAMVTQPRRDRPHDADGPPLTQG